MEEGEDACAGAFENILNEVGHFGLFQKRLFLLSTWMQMMAVTAVLYFGLLTELPTKYNYQCLDTNATTDQTTDQSKCKNLTITGPEHNLPEWMYTNHSSSGIETIAYTQTSGLVTGTLLGGFTADLAGRKHVLFLCYTLMMLSHALIPVCSDITCFGIGRFITNLFAGGFIIPSSVLYTEYVGRNWRDVCICACLWWLGTIILSITSAITHNWRYIAIATGVLGLPLSGLFFLFPESFRWFCCRQKFRMAENTLKDMTSCNSHTQPDVTSVCDQITIAVINTMRVRTYTYLDVLKTKRLLTSSVILCTAGCVSCIVYRCLMAKVWDLTDNLYIDNSLRYSIDLPVIFTALIISKCIGRRWCLFLYSMSSGFALVCILLLSIVNNLLKDEEIVTGISLFGKLGVAATIVLLFLVSLEVFPTTVRCMGTALVMTCFICGLAVGRYFCAYLIQTFHYTSTFIGYGCCMCFVGFASLLLPETFNKPLPDIVRSQHRIIASKESTRISHEGWHML